ncbi:MAG: NINE protein [Asgard group archaeon]|nr:NINE protein [Asgard group archaeon]
MSYESWYPRTVDERKHFLVRSLPMFVILLVFILYGLDWLGAYEFLEVLVRNNSAWLLKIIWGFEDFTIGYIERRDPDPLTGGIIRFGEPHFPGITMDTYPRDLLIIRACTGMQAGALLMALIFVTPAKWQNKTIAHIVNLLMMHIGNTFRVAFHFWYTQHLYQKFIAEGMAMFDAADKAFDIAHDSLSKVFGFIGIVIFTLVIERTGVKIVSTFGAWIDSISDGFKGITNRVEKNAHYEDARVSHKKLATSEEEEPARVTELIKQNFYPRDQINNNNWTFFRKRFYVFFGAAIGIMALGLIPSINQAIGLASDKISVGFGAFLNGNGFLSDLHASNPDQFSNNPLWWGSDFQGLSLKNSFAINIASSGMLLFGIVMAAIIVTPGKWKNKSVALSITPFIIFPLNILRLGFQKWATWKLANFDALKAPDGRPLLYLNLTDMVTNWIPFVFWISVFVLLIFIFNKLQVKVFATMWAWLHQIVISIGWVIGLRDRPGEKPSTSSRSQTITLLMCIFGGFFGAHHYYAGRRRLGRLYLFTFGFLGLGVARDIIVIMAGEFLDSNGLIINGWKSKKKDDDVFSQETSSE